MTCLRVPLPEIRERPKVVSFRITRGNVRDAKKFCPLVRGSSKKYNIDKVCADKAQDDRRNFNLPSLQTVLQ